MSHNAPPNALTIPGLEQVYDHLATAIDAVGPEKTELFLVKLALLMAHAIGDEQRVTGLIADAQQD